ncbi:MAG: hypothetical protein R3247_01340 [Rhodothermales bacterium]|nr:hypothetical protein [Rhodothermales bacterium]
MRAKRLPQDPDPSLWPHLEGEAEDLRQFIMRLSWAWWGDCWPLYEAAGCPCGRMIRGLELWAECEAGSWAN